MSNSPNLDHTPQSNTPLSDADLPDTKPKSKSKGSAKLLSWVWSISKYVLVFLLIYTVINWWRQPVMPANPELTLTDYHGQVIDINAMSHQSPVLVYFWGSWCGVCQVTSPTIDALSDSSPYPVVSIAVQSGSDQELGQYMASKGFDFTTINDQSGSIFQAWQGQVTPSYVILKDGEMTQGLTGIQPQWSLRLRLWLSSLG